MKEMKEMIKNQISSEIFEKISELENEKNQEKQKVIAQEIIEDLSFEDFTPYIAYDDEGDIFIAMNYRHSHNGIEEALLSEKHDVAITSDGVYIEDESYLETLKKEKELNNQIEIKELREEQEKKNKEEWEEIRAEQRKEIKNQKRYDEISEKLEFLGNQLQYLVNFERPKCGNAEKITEIDEEIANLENRIENLKKELEELEK